MAEEPASGALDGLRIVAFESRRSSELGHLLGRHGAEVLAAPALREIPLESNPAADELLDRLENGSLDVLILLTGVGTRALVQALAPRLSAHELATRLARVPIVARGPKPAAALRELGLTPTVRVPEPNTWRELLAALDRELPVSGRRVAVQEYGRPSAELYDGLAARGAEVLPVPVYAWALPLDLAPLQSAIEQLCDGAVEIAVFTSAVQLDHLLEVAAASPGKRDAVLAALRERVVVAAIGPTARGALLAHGIGVDLEPEHPKLGFLAAAIAERGPAAVARKRAG